MRHGHRPPSPPPGPSWRATRPRPAPSAPRSPRPTWPRPACRPRRSPDPHAFGRRKVELVAGLDVEGGIPGVHVAHGVGAELGRRMAVGDRALAGGRLAGLGPPALRKGDEELLVAAEPLLARPFLAAVGQAIGVVGRIESGDVGDVLAYHLFA